MADEPDGTPTKQPAPAFADPIPGVIGHGTITLFSGASGAGKTIFVSDYCRRFIDGRTIHGYPTNRPTTLCYITADRPWFPTYASTFANVGLSDIAYYSIADHLSPTDEDPRKWSKYREGELLERCLQRANPPPGSLVFLDPAIPLFVLGNQNAPKDVATTCHFWRQLINLYDISLFCMANIVKQKADPAGKHTRPQDRLSGSGAWAAHTDTQIWLIDDDERGGPVRLGWKPRRGPEWEGSFTFDEATRLFVPHTPLGDVGSLDEAVMAVLALLPADGLRFTDWCDLAIEHRGISRRTFQNYRTALQTHGYIILGEDACYYRRKPS